LLLVDAFLEPGIGMLVESFLETNEFLAL